MGALLIRGFSWVPAPFACPVIGFILDAQALVVTLRLYVKGQPAYLWSVELNRDKALPRHK